jgi:PAS domain-containing protein
MALAAVGKTQHSLTGPVKYVIFFNSYVTIDLQIIDSLQDYSIFTLDNEFKINTWSSGSETIFGYETEEVIGKPFEIIFTEEDINIGIPKKKLTQP